jgi:hypothetical protein
LSAPARSSRRHADRRAGGTAVALRVISRAGLWSALAFVFNLAWEIAHVRLYTIWAAADGVGIAWALLHCTLGDVLIALTMFTTAGLALRRADWPASHPWTGGAIAVIGAMAFTASSEWYNVYRAGSWAYAPSMPTLFGIGLTPLLQWLILPPMMVAACRKLEPVVLWRQRRGNCRFITPLVHRNQQ